MNSLCNCSRCFKPFPFLTTLKGAVQIINHRLCEKINQLNNLKHQVEMRKLRLEELQTQYSTKAQEINDMQEMEEGNIEAAKVREA